jgi:hypothetical protein
MLLPPGLLRPVRRNFIGESEEKPAVHAVSPFLASRQTSKIDLSGQPAFNRLSLKTNNSGS